MTQTETTKLKAQDLRIGNLVQHEPYPDEIWTVDMKLLESIELQLLECAGIPLTPEILWKCGFINRLRCGFPENRNNYQELSSGRFSFGWDEAGFEFEVDGSGECYPLNNIKYLHQLQNFYFDLTGTELNVENNIK